MSTDQFIEGVEARTVNYDVYLDIRLFWRDPPAEHVYGDMPDPHPLYPGFNRWVATRLSQSKAIEEWEHGADQSTPTAQHTYVHWPIYELYSLTWQWLRHYDRAMIALVYGESIEDIQRRT